WGAPYISPRLAVTLMDATTDKDPLVHEQIFSSLCFLGEEQPEEVLHACEEYLRQHDKLAYPHRVIILRAMEAVTKSSLAHLDKSTAKVVIFLASSEMTKSKEAVPEWQQAASSVLVAVGRRFINQVMEEVLTKFQPGVLPHPFVVQTFASLAVANVFGMVPFLTSILGTMLPMLRMARQESLKSVFCYALQHFSESIQEYLANLDQAPDPTVRRDTFSNEIFSAFDVLFNSWLPSRETKLRLAVVEALGPMSHLLPGEKLEEQLPRLVPGILALYRKPAEAYHVSKVGGGALAPRAPGRPLPRGLRGHVGLQAVLCSSICAPPDLSMPVSLKNHNEVLRCFTVLASAFPDRVLAFLLPRLESGNERARVGTLTILRQIINSVSSQMEAKKLFILSSLKLPLQDSSNKVKRAAVQLISAMAHHGYLEQPGGEALIEFLVRQCALPAEQVRASFVSTLCLLSSTVDRMADVLWPSLLAFVTPVHLTGALAPLCRSLIYLAGQRQEEDEALALPSLCRQVVASRPHAGEGRAAAALRLLAVLHRSLHKALQPLWSEEIPALVGHLEGKGGSGGRLALGGQRGRVLSGKRPLRGPSAVRPQTGCRLLARGRSPLPSPPQSFLYKSIGTALAACLDKELVQRQLQELLETARYQEEAEKEGLAACLGLCAASHLDETLAKLEEFVKSDLFKKSAGLFSLFKDRSDNEAEKVKGALILCYGHVARHAPPELVLARIDTDFLRNIFLYFHTKVLGIKVETKDLTLKLCLIRSICMICQAVCSSAQARGFSFARKGELVLQMMDFIRAEPPDSLHSPVRQRAMAACVYLVGAAPGPGAPRAGIGSLRGSPERLLLPLSFQPLWDGTLRALKDLLRSLLCRHVTPHGLQTMFEHLSPWIRSAEERERARAVELGAVVLHFYWEKLNVSTVMPFHNLGQLAALLSPRCTDSLASVRRHAVDGICALLYVQLCYEGFSRDHRDESIERLKALKASLRDPDVHVLFQACCTIAKVVAKRLPPEQLLSLLLALLGGLADPDRNCSRAAAVLINAVLKERGAVLAEKVPEILATVHAKLQEVDEEPVRKAAQQTVCILAAQHKAAVVAALLGQPLPLDRSTGTMWRALATEPTLASQVLELLLEKVNHDVPYKETKSFLRGGGPERVATLLPLSATCALHEIMSVRESGPAVAGLYADLFASLLLRVSCAVGVLLPKAVQASERKSAARGQPLRALDPCSSAVETLQAMLARGGSEEVVQSVAQADGWELLRSTEKHHEGVALLARALARHAGPKLPPVVRNLAPMLSSIYDSQRLTTTAFLAELLGSSVASDLVLLESLMDSMAARQRDPCTAVRVLALRGLGNMASGSPDKVRKHGAHLLAAMVSGLDDRDDPQQLVALEAMRGLSALLPFLEERDVQPMLLHLAIRIRPFFDSERCELRTASIALFGSLSKFTSGAGEEAFFEQILNGLVTLLLHLQDPKPEVVKACKFALRMCGPRMGCALLCDMFQNHLHEDRCLHYGEFMNDVSKHLMQSYPETLSRLVATNLFYFKSNWADLRAAAPMFVGFLVLHVDKAHSQQLDLEQLIAGEREQPGGLAGTGHASAPPA
uniref:Maestro heat like repeat family member 1 n=1 Tax=Varanus komodoensis TaxID=61221 RepID=A0A8D2IWM4_VARKO